MLLARGERKALILITCLLSLGGALKAHQVHETRWGQAFRGEPPSPTTPKIEAPRAGERVAFSLWPETDSSHLMEKTVKTRSSEQPTKTKAFPFTGVAGRVAGKPKGSCPVDLNAASAQVLAGLPGVGPKTAEAIVEFRRQHGAFHAITDIMEVKGIGQKKLDRMRSCLILSTGPNLARIDNAAVFRDPELQKP